MSEHDAPESYPTPSLDYLAEAAINRYEEHVDVHGQGDDWMDCAPEDLRAKARENLVDADCDADYADALNYLVMAWTARMEQRTDELRDGRPFPDAVLAAWRWETQAPGLDEWYETIQGEPPEELHGERADREFEVRNVTPLYERRDDDAE